MIEKRKCFPNTFNIILIRKSEIEILEEGDLGVSFTHEHSNKYHKQSASGLKTKCVTTQFHKDNLNYIIFRIQIQLFQLGMNLIKYLRKCPR